MSDIPINFIRADVFKDNGEKKYDRDLWIRVAGKIRDKATTMNGFKEYMQIDSILNTFLIFQIKIIDG